MTSLGAPSYVLGSFHRSRFPFSPQMPLGSSCLSPHSFPLLYRLSPPSFGTTTGLQWRRTAQAVVCFYPNIFLLIVWGCHTMHPDHTSFLFFPGPPSLLAPGNCSSALSTSFAILDLQCVRQWLSTSSWLGKRTPFLTTEISKHYQVLGQYRGSRVS